MCKIEITRERGSLKELSEQLNEIIGNKLEIKTEIIIKKNYRSISPEILVATIGASSLILRELIKGLFSLREKLAEQRIVMSFKDGERIEVPADIDKTELTNLLDEVDKRGIKKVDFKY